MSKGQLSRLANAGQESVENPMFSLGVALALLEHDMLRVRQAIRRCGLDDLLSPVLNDYDQITRELRHLQTVLRSSWEDGQSKRWSP